MPLKKKKHLEESYICPSGMKEDSRMSQSNLQRVHQRSFKKASPPHQQLVPQPHPHGPCALGGGTERSTGGWGQDGESHLASGWPLRGTPL